MARPGGDDRFARRATRSGLRRYPAHVLAALAPGALRGGAFASAEREAERVARLADVRRHPFAAAWLGHATILLSVDGRVILTDPVLADRIGVRVGPVTVGTPRITPAPIAPGDLPRPDLVLLTHAHFDHLDRPTLAAIAHPATTVVTARGTARLVPRGFAAVHELDWNDEFEFAGLRLRAMRPAHWGARTVVDRRRGFNAYVVTGAERRVLLAGDTADTDVFDDLASAPGPPLVLAAFGIGAYDPWIHAHANPEQVWSMFSRSGAARLLPMHHSTFELSDEPAHEPMDRLLAAAADPATPGSTDAVVRVDPGAVWTPRDDVDRADAEPDPRR